MKAIPNFYKGKIKWEGSDEKSWKLVSTQLLWAKKSIAEGELIKEGTMILEIVDRDNMGMVFGLMDVTSLLC